ncbi:MAG: ribosome-binding factor [Verrucomicrobiales bacterium]|nr:ribosome-binding factor [Verrucomicrobiales bacterium]
MSLRMERVQELLKRELGEVIRREIPVDEGGLISVNNVHVSSDLHTANVFVGILGDDEQKKKSVALLEKNRKRFQGLIAKAVVLKYTPQLRFIHDESIEKGNRVLEILEELDKGSPPLS